MNKDPTKLRDLVKQAHAFACKNGSDAVLFIGSPSAPIPRALITDVDLPPWSRMLWCYWRARSESSSSGAIASDYDTIRKELGISGKATVATAIQALRLTRWITRMPLSKGKERFNSRVYLLHALPLTYQQAVEIDPDYAAWILEAIRSKSRPIRNLAHRIVDRAMEFADKPEPGFSDELGRLVQSSQRSTQWACTFQRSHPDQARKIHDCEPPPQTQDVELEFYDAILKFNDFQKSVAEAKIRYLPEQYQQAYLNDLVARVIKREGSQRPVQNPLSYLQWMVNQYLDREEIVLNGDGENLKRVLNEKSGNEFKKQAASLRQTLQEQQCEIEYFNRMIEASHDLPAKWMTEGLQEAQEAVRKTRRRIEEMKDEAFG